MIVPFLAFAAIRTTRMLPFVQVFEIVFRVFIVTTNLAIKVLELGKITHLGKNFFQCRGY